MIAHTAILAAVVLFLLAGWLAEELAFLARHRDVIFARHGGHILVIVLLVYVNLSGLFYVLASWLFLRETGRKLAHVDRQLTTSDSVLDDLRTQLRP
jgi:hypothetical protein